MKTPSLTTATETATDALGSASSAVEDTVGDTLGDIADSAGDLMGEVMDLAGELTSQAADRFVEGAVLAAGSSRFRSKRIGVALLVLALAAAALVFWRRRSTDQAGSQEAEADQPTRIAAA